MFTASFKIAYIHAVRAFACSVGLLLVTPSYADESELIIVDKPDSENIVAVASPWIGSRSKEHGGGIVSQCSPSQQEATH